RGVSTKVPSENLSFRVFVATWNVGGKSPDTKLNLDDILQVREESDIYVLGFQEVVPLNAGNVLVIEDNEPAAKWLALINQSLNKAHNVPLRGPRSIASSGGSLVFQKTSLRKVSKAFRTESKRRLKSCNCPTDLGRKNSKEFCFRCPQSQTNENEFSSEEDEDGSSNFDTNQIKYGLVACKQMVGIFLTVWTRKELVQHVSHLRISCVGRGILGCLGNKQLKIEREAGRVFKGWKEGKIYFAPTYKYSDGSNRYAGETVETKSKRRTPAWCDRILWHGSKIYQLSYGRKESRFSDHRPVCATFWVSVEATEDGSRKR
ncbi:DNAse I-like superfamily protein, putative isoform 5, partial [Theobroma cacao]